jgi:hypothetical protein
MNTTLVFEILQLAVGLTQSHVSGTTAGKIAVTQTLLDIVQKGTAAYQQHTGQPLDQTLIKPETTL